MGGDRIDRKPRGQGGSKRKFIQAFGGDKTVAIPYGKQGILVTLLTPNLSRAGREAVNIFTEAWEDLIAQGVKQGPFVAPILPKPAPATEGQAQRDATKSSDDAPSEAEPPAAKSARAGGDSAAPDVQAATAPTTAAAPPATTAEASPEEQAGDALDFSKMISSEVKDLKDVKKQPFVVHDTGVKTCMFVGMPLAAEDKPGPCEVVKHVLRKAKESRVLRLRHCLRLLPCTHVVRSQAGEIEAATKAAVAMAIDCSADAKPVTAAVMYEHRAAPTTLVRRDLIDCAIAHVPRPPHSVKLKGADKTISIQVMRNSCGVAVLDDYEDLRKYNIKTLCQDPEETAAGAAKTASAEVAQAAEPEVTEAEAAVGEKGATAAGCE